MYRLNKYWQNKSNHKHNIRKNKKSKIRMICPMLHITVQPKKKVDNILISCAPIQKS